MDASQHDSPSPDHSELERIAEAAERVADNLSHFRNLVDGALQTETAEVLFHRLKLLAQAAFATESPTDCMGIAALLNYQSEKGARLAASAAPHQWVGRSRFQKPCDVLFSREKPRRPCSANALIAAAQKKTERFWAPQWRLIVTQTALRQRVKP